MNILVAIPVHNERKYVEQVLREARLYHDQILFVDDASTDGTSDWLAGQRGIHLVRHAANRGYGQAIISAFDYAQANGFDWTITLDCDEQHEPKMIPQFVDAIRADVADVISGSRYLGDELGHDLPPGDRRAVNATVTAMINDVFGWALTDSFCGFKAHRTEAMTRLKLNETGYAFPLQLWPRVYASDLRVTELPVRRIYNDPTRTFGANLDDAGRRLRHYIEVFRRELVQLGIAFSDVPGEPPAGVLDLHRPDAKARTGETCGCGG